MKTLYLSDLDGTLLNGDAEIPEYTRRTLRKLVGEGMNFSVATARSPVSARRILTGLELKLPAVLMNGVLLYDLERDRPVLTHYLGKAAYTVLAREIEGRGLSCFVYAMGEDGLSATLAGEPTPPMRGFMEERIRKYGKVFLSGGFGAPRPEEVIYLTLFYEYERLAPLATALSGVPGVRYAFYRDIYSPSMWFLEIFSAAATKRSGCEALRGRFGFDRVVAFGDNRNDLSLFEGANERYAVANACLEVLAAADGVIPGNGEDGVAKKCARHYGGIVLETPRMTLRRMRAEDFPALFAMMSDPEVMYAWEHGFTRAEIAAWMSRRYEDYREYGYSYFVAERKEDGGFVGQLGLLPETPDGKQAPGVSWLLDKRCRHMGYATEGGKALLEYAFGVLGAPRVIADIRPENAPSRRVAERLGMREVSRFDKPVGGKLLPHIVYEKIRPER